MLYQPKDQTQKGGESMLLVGGLFAPSVLFLIWVAWSNTLGCKRMARQSALNWTDKTIVPIRLVHRRGRKNRHFYRLYFRQVPEAKEDDETMLIWRRHPDVSILRKAIKTGSGAPVSIVLRRRPVRIFWLAAGASDFLQFQLI